VLYNMFSVPYVVSFVAVDECNADSPLWDLLVPLSQVSSSPLPPPHCAAGCAALSRPKALPIAAC
jgi:hypothetical protein